MHAVVRLASGRDDHVGGSDIQAGSRWQADGGRAAVACRSDRGAGRVCARDTETDRRVSAGLIREMREAELFRILQPARFGGFEYGYDTFVNATIAIGAGDGSTGWVYSLGAVHQWLIGCFPPQAQHDVWDDDPHAMSAVSYAPTGNAERVDGGYRVSGRWSFASGVDNVQWAIIAGLLQKPDGEKAPGFFLCRGATTPSTTTGSRWGLPAPAARRWWRSALSFPSTVRHSSRTC